jgi:outer membrane protein OmpA-like peptidoglycan-associated protein
LKKVIIYLSLLFFINNVIFSQEENLEEIKEEEILEEKTLEEEKEEEVKAEETVFRDPIFGIDYTNKDLGAMTDFDIINERDTLKYRRELGDWWFGLYFNPGYNYYIGNYEFSKFSYLPNINGNPKVEYSTEPTFTILNLGLLTEWNPVRQVWGLGARIQYERLLVNSFYEPTDVNLRNRVFNTEVYFDYLGISPYFKYKTPLENFNLFAGLDLLFPMSYEATFRDQESGTSKIIDEKVITDKVIDIGLRYGAHFGAEYEIMVMDIQRGIFGLKNTRMKIAPFTVVGFSSSPVSSSKNSYPLTWKIGLSVKFGPDNITADTIRYNPTPRYDYLAKFDTKIKIEFEGFLVREKFDPVDMAIVEVDKVNTQISEEPKNDFGSALRDKEDSQISSTLKEEEEPKHEFKKGFNKTFTFKTSTDTRPTREMRKFLDDLADWMKNNPNAEIRVVGHSDQVGTGREIQERSVKRAKEVQTYIVGKTGINPRRILTTGEGARKSVADIYTEEGKAQNRRVEIIVVGG